MSEINGEPPKFADNFGTELEVQIQFFRDMITWCEKQNNDVLRSKEFNLKLYAHTTVWAMTFLRLASEGEIQPYDGLEGLTQWWGTKSVGDLSDFGEELVEKVTWFFHETFGGKVIEC